MGFTSTENLVKVYVTDLFDRLISPYLTYHNLLHTEKVVDHTKEIVKYYKLDERAEFAVIAAAWFHDTGHLVTDMESHEEESVRIMKSFLEKQNVDAALIDMIAVCIMATRYPPSPETLLEAIICDADTYHFGTKYFEITDDLVRKEMQLRTNVDCSNWYRDSLKLLQDHRFFTVYCRDKLESGKQENIRSLQRKVEAC